MQLANYSEKLADAWAQLPNANRIFGGQTPLAYMIRGGIGAMEVGTAPTGCTARRHVKLPATTLVRQFDTHRLIPSKYSAGGESVLGRIADDDGHLKDIFDLDNATNDRLKAENNLLPGIGVDELVFGVPYDRIVNAAFCHAQPLGSRFNGPDRGAGMPRLSCRPRRPRWRFTRVSSWPRSAGRRKASPTTTTSPISAPSCTTFAERAFKRCLDPDSYVASQELAQQLLAGDALGIIYSSVRRPGGICLACFRPALVMNVRKAGRYRFTWDKSGKLKIAADALGVIDSSVRRPGGIVGTST